MLVVCSVYDCVKEQSVMITMNETVADAIRQFEIACSAPHISHIKNDLVLYRVGYFDIKDLVIEGEEKTLLKYGADVPTLPPTVPTDMPSVDPTDIVERVGEVCGE